MQCQDACASGIAEHRRRLQLGDHDVAHRGPVRSAGAAAAAAAAGQADAPVRHLVGGHEDVRGLQLTQRQAHRRSPAIQLHPRYANRHTIKSQFVPKKLSLQVSL
jgi:hypothetical protein